MSSILEKDLDLMLNYRLPFEKLFNKTILISGANGFLAAYIVHFLMHLNKCRDANIKVIGLVRNSVKARDRFQQYLPHPNLRFLEQNVCEEFQIDEKIHFIIHAASQASPRYYGRDPVGTILANTQGTTNLLKIAQNNPIESFLYVSSGEVYGKVDPLKIPISEVTQGEVNQLEVRSCYAEGKRAGETLCISWFHQYQVPIRIVRPFHTYGPGFNLDDGRVFADFVSDIINNRNIRLYSDGSATRSFCYIADACLGFIAALLLGKPGSAYNIAGDTEVSMLALGNLLCELFPEKALKVEFQNSAKQNYIPSPFARIVADISKAGKELSWRPIIPLHDGFKRTVASFL